MNYNDIAKKIRIDVLDLIYNAGSGHIGGSLSIVDLLTILYFNEMNIDVNDLKSNSRDRFVLSKGHAAPALYSTLYEKGIISKNDLKHFRQVNGKLQGHPDMKKVPGIDMSTGSLGQGASCAVGMALASKLDNSNFRVYTILGDGELEEGEVWESFMTSTKYNLDNLVFIIDNNDLQIDGKISDVSGLNKIDEKLLSFGLNIITINGHNFDEIKNAFKCAKNIKNKPTAIIAKTIKGKGISFMENEPKWHGKVPNGDEYNLALEELES